MSLSIILATRCRPGTLVKTLQTTLANIAREDTKLVVAVDDDDSGTLSCRQTFTDKRLIWSVEPREDSLGAKYNRVLNVAPADVYCVMVDYAPFTTAAFDERILEAAEVYPDGYSVILNHLANLSFSQINAVTHKMAETMGGVYCEDYPYWFIDHQLEDIARQIGRQVFVDVLTDCSKRPGTMEKKEPGFWGQAFNALHVERAKIARKIIESEDFDETPARKRALLRNQTLVYEWSSIINSMIQNDPGEPVSPSDTRYMRIRQKMVDKLVGMGLAKFEPLEQKKAA